MSILVKYHDSIFDVTSKGYPTFEDAREIGGIDAAEACLDDVADAFAIGCSEP